MAFLERKWVLALLVLGFIAGYNGISGWVESRGTLLPMTQGEAETAADIDPVSNGSSTPSAVVSEPKTVMVYVCGAVKKPGVFSLLEGSRVNDALQLAGGFSEKADKVNINLAEQIMDGQQIIIYEKGTAVNQSIASGTAKAKGISAPTAPAGLPVSINNGSQEALMLLDGIGEKTAQKIMDYRKAQGGFKTIEELKNVPGIGDKKFEQIKNDVKL